MLGLSTVHFWCIVDVEIMGSLKTFKQVDLCLEPGNNLSFLFR
jgi:hypothetical protein